MDRDRSHSHTHPEDVTAAGVDGRDIALENDSAPGVFVAGALRRVVAPVAPAVPVAHDIGPHVVAVV